jgi:NTE family protein
MTPPAGPRLALVLGGGAIKGFAHIGALRALAERGVMPTVFAGSSIGALVASAAAGGMDVDSMTRRALSLRRKDLFRINHMGMLLDRMQSRSIYMEAPLRTLVDHVVPQGTFAELGRPLLVTAVDVEQGIEVVWGAPGMRDVSIRDAVYASCALPGFFPPGTVGGRPCIDGGTTDNLPVAIAALNVDAVIAVDVGIADVPHAEGLGQQGFATVYMRAATLMMHTLQARMLERWHGPPLLLVRPKVSHISWFSFQHTRALIEAGYDAMQQALGTLDTVLNAHGGVYPRRPITLAVDRARCVGCGLCVSLAPHLMAMEASGKAVPTTPHLSWSPADGAFVRQCPTGAIVVTDRVGIPAALPAAGGRPSAESREPSAPPDHANRPPEP